MRWQVIPVILFGLAVAFLVRHSSVPVDPANLSELQNALLLFEKQAECEAHSPCFYANVDGAGQRDPQNARRQCEEGIRRLKSVEVPDGFPPDVERKLTLFKSMLLTDMESFLNPSRAHPTCQAYGVIDGVNQRYGVKSMMKGHYINCNVLKSYN